MSLLDKASLVVTPNAYKASKLYSVIPNTTLGDMDVVRATTATRVNSSSLIESVAINIPRIDYTSGSCPSLLVEPQRTNSIQYSNAISAYFFSGVGVINAVTSPQGINNAFSFDVTNGTMGGLSPVTITTSAQSYTFSIYLKGSVNGQKVRLFGDLNGAIQDFTLTTEWARYTKTFTGVAGAQSIYLLNGSYFSPAQNDLYYGYGMQLEVGAYATSLIPTTGSALTRNMDIISKTGISSLIGQTEGTLFCDVNLNSRSSYTYLALSTDLTTSSNYLGIAFLNNAIAFEIVVAAALQANISYSNSSTGRFKIAAGYKANDFVLYINGVQIGVDTSGTVPACSQLGLTAFSQTAPLNYNSVQVYKTKLSNTELAQLTTL